MGILEIIRSIPWRPGIGDPSLFGWLTALTYLVAATACGACARQAPRIFKQGPVWQHRLIWGGLAAALLFLGLNKQLDVHSWFTAVVKTIASVQGWYAMGQRYQNLIVASMALASLAIVAVSGWQMRRLWRQYWLLLLGFILLARFIIVRAAGFYAVPLPELSRFTGGLKINWLLEIVGAGCIACAALLNWRRGRAAYTLIGKENQW